MAFSPFKKAHVERIDVWEVTLKNMSYTFEEWANLQRSDIFDEWVKVQRSWMYLEPIFSSEDIMRQLPAEGKRYFAYTQAVRCFVSTKLLSDRFEKVDIKWRKALSEAHAPPPS
ncbi:hypothetical protein T492DRAFT_834897 [Pavlovales sp. CCMP2436]|nr:hypothetical protein T492DRAFT_834897 [Pavlovales sp. CCMP2436]